MDGSTVVGPPPLPTKADREAEAKRAGAPEQRKRDNTVMYTMSAPPSGPQTSAPSLDTQGVPDSLPDAMPASQPATTPAGPTSATPGARSAPRAPQGDVDHDAETRLSSVEELEGDDDEGERSAYIGKLIDERYLVKSLVGRGGMGAVYRVEQIHLRKEMAIKLLHENLISKKQLVSRFTREARAISRLSSPHTVMVYDFGRWGEVFYLVMELLEGEPLDDLLVREGPTPALRATAILMQMCDSLAEAHRAGIVHRDLKPENVMLLSGGPHPDFVKILDFGLAKVEDVDDPYTIHSQKDIFGTPFYMSPEQIRAGDIDGRSDIYAVGALAFRMLTGHQVFGHERSTFDILKAHLMEPPPSMRDVAPDAKVPDALEHIVARCLAKDPKDRFQTMDELAEALVEARKTDFVTAGIAPPKQATSPADQMTPREKKRTAALLADDDALEGHVRRTGRRQRLGFLVAVLVFAAAGAAVVMNLSSAGVGQEQEPNDSYDQANQLDANGEARGAIGQRRSREVSDRDCFKLPEMTAETDLSVTLRGVPTMDLEVSLLDSAGVPRATLSHRPEGRGEVLRHVDTRFSPRTVCVTERRAPGKVAGESLSDTYTLRVETTKRSAWTEVEPNDGKRTNDLPGGKSVRGTLDGPGDVDVFRLQDRFDGRVLRIKIASANSRPLDGLRVAVVDAKGRVLTAEVLRDGDKDAVLAFAATAVQEPERIVVQWAAAAKATWKPGPEDEIAYTMWYRVEDLTDQSEREPNNTPASAAPMVLGAWHVGSASDAAGVDWLRIDAGDPSMRRIRLEASAPEGNAYSLTIRDVGTNVDVRKVEVAPGTANHDLLVHGSGAGYLLKVVRTPPEPTRRGRRARKPLGSRYRLRARWALPGGEDLKLDLPGQ